MSIIYFDPANVRLKKFAASTVSAAGKTTSVVRIELVSNDPYAIAGVLASLEEVDREQRAADRPARQNSRPTAPRPRAARRIAGAEPLLMLPYHGEDT